MIPDVQQLSILSVLLLNRNADVLGHAACPITLTRKKSASEWLNISVNIEMNMKYAESFWKKKRKRCKSGQKI